MFITRQKQRETTGQTENKHFIEPPHYTHFQQDKQMLMVAADAVLTQTLTIMPPWFFGRIPKHSDTYAVVTFLILALKQGSHTSKNFKNLRLWTDVQTQTDSQTDKHKIEKKLKNQHCCQCWSPKYWISVLSTRYGRCHHKGFIVSS